MARHYRHSPHRENGPGLHYSGFQPSSLQPIIVHQSFEMRKFPQACSNRPSQASSPSQFSGLTAVCFSRRTRAASARTLLRSASRSFDERLQTRQNPPTQAPFPLGFAFDEALELAHRLGVELTSKQPHEAAEQLSAVGFDEIEPCVRESSETVTFDIGQYLA